MKNFNNEYEIEITIRSNEADVLTVLKSQVLRTAEIAIQLTARVRYHSKKGFEHYVFPTIKKDDTLIAEKALEMLSRQRAIGREQHHLLASLIERVKVSS